MSGFSACLRTQKEATWTNFLKKSQNYMKEPIYKAKTNRTKIRSVHCSKSRSGKFPEVETTESLKEGDTGGQQENPIYTEANPGQYMTYITHSQPYKNE